MSPARRHAVLLATLAAACLVPSAASAPQGKEPPRVVVASPLGVGVGSTTRLTLRGLRLDDATEVRCHAPKARARLLGKGKAPVGNPLEVPLLGDTRIEMEVTLPEDHPGHTVTVSVVTAAGESPPQALLVERGPVVAEREPNDGFTEAQPVTLPLELRGSIGRPQDVDLFGLQGRARQRLVCEIFAARVGSPLDALLTLYDQRGSVVASNDDAGGSSDPRLEVVLPHDGVYFLGVTDANDQGGPLYLYRLSVHEAAGGR
jgi:hypothetical protein